MESETPSDKLSAPRLILFTSGQGDLEEAVIVSDGSKIFTRTNDIFEAVMLLIGTYYVADFSYPKVYCNMLSILQQHVVGEAYVGDRSARCIVFVKKHADLLAV